MSEVGRARLEFPIKTTTARANRGESYIMHQTRVVASRGTEIEKKKRKWVDCSIIFLNFIQIDADAAICNQLEIVYK